MSVALQITHDLDIKANSLDSEARELVIVTEQDYRDADRFGRAARDLLKAIDEAFDPVIEAAHRSHKAALDAKKKQAAPVEAIKKIVADKMGAWYRAEQARVAEERRKAEEAARKMAEEEALRIAEELAAQGMHEAAEAALDEPIVERVVVAEAPKLDGVSYRETWSADVVDLMQLVKAVASGAAPIAYLSANQTTLNGAARVYKNTFKIPGVVFRPETIQARR